MPECRVSDVPSFLHRNCYERLVKFKDPKFEVRDQLRNRHLLRRVYIAAAEVSANTATEICDKKCRCAAEIGGRELRDRPSQDKKPSVMPTCRTLWRAESVCRRNGGT